MSRLRPARTEVDLERWSQLSELPNDVPAHFRHLAFQPMGSPETSPLYLPDWGRMEGTGVNAGKMKYSEKQ